jgi:hypothetical protein
MKKRGKMDRIKKYIHNSTFKKKQSFKNAPLGVEQAARA